MVIAGHPTSLRLESTFWKLLRVIAVECSYSITGLIDCIAITKHPKQNLSSAIRVYVAAYFYGAAPHQVLVDPTSKFAIRLGPTRDLNRSLYRARRSVKVLDELDERYGTRSRQQSSRPPRPRAA
jgi:predicted DNA-binding ribbon-helix-helix protein